VPDRRHVLLHASYRQYGLTLLSALPLPVSSARIFRIQIFFYFELSFDFFLATCYRRVFCFYYIHIRDRFSSYIRCKKLRYIRCKREIYTDDIDYLSDTNGNTCDKKYEICYSCIHICTDALR